MKNYGLDLERETQERDDERDWMVGAADEPRRTCLAEIPPVEREHYLPAGEVQRSDNDDMMDCASRWLVNVIEAKFNYLLANDLITSANKRWLIDSGYLTERGVEFSDAFVAINSGTTRRGNSLKAPLEAARKHGLVPKHRLPLQPDMTFEQYHDPDRISGSLRALGLQFTDRFTINYERVPARDFATVYDYDMIGMAGYAWGEPDSDGVYQPAPYPPNHAFAAVRAPEHVIFDNYIDSTDGDFIKRLAPDYGLLDYGYRVYISSQQEPGQETPEHNSFWTYLKGMLVSARAGLFGSSVPPIVIKPIVYSTSKTPWFEKYHPIAIKEMVKAKAVRIEPIAIELLKLDEDFTPGTYLDSDGVRRISFNWLYEHLSKKAVAKGYNMIALHFTEAERKAWKLTKRYNGAYWLDHNPLFEFWFCADDGEWSPNNRSNLPQYLRLFLHEAGHGLVHFADLKEQLVVQLGIQQATGNARDPVHYLDYKVKDVRKLFPMISFERWSLLKQLKELLEKLKEVMLQQIESDESVPPLLPISHPEPKPAPKTSPLEAWADAIKVFEDYVEPGGRYRDGSLAPNGSLSYRNHNPGNLRWSPTQIGQRDGFSYFSTYEQGWKALLHQLTIAADGRSTVYWPDMTLLQFFDKYAPSSDGNWPKVYAAFVAERIGVPVETPIKNLL